MVTNNQINTGKPIEVSNGGTGDASFTAYSLIAAGTTSTGALQSAGTGTAGQWYVSNGNASLGTFKKLTISNQVFTGSGTYTPSAGMIYCNIQAMGGGGAGGGSPSTAGGQTSVGSGGGAGEYAVGIFTAAQIGASKTVTIGAGGAAASGTTGGDGGNTSVGSLISAFGGFGGGFAPAGANAAAEVGAGGTGGTGGDYRTPGMTSNMRSFGSAGQIVESSGGANSQLGSGGAATGSPSAGNDGSGYGAGGSGSAVGSSHAAVAGGNGAAGIVIVTEYIIA